MHEFIVNTRQNKDGYHVVHVAGVGCNPAKKYQHSLGHFDHYDPAIAEAVKQGFKPARICLISYKKFFHGM